MKILIPVIVVSLLAAYGAPEERRCRIISRGGGKGMICTIQPRYRHWVDDFTRLLP